MSPFARLRSPSALGLVILGSVVIAACVTMLTGLVTAGGLAMTTREQVSDGAAPMAPADDRIVVVALDEDFFQYLEDTPWGVLALANALGAEVGELTRSYMVRDEVLAHLNPQMAETEFADLVARVFSGFDGAVLTRTDVVVLGGDREAAPKVLGDEAPEVFRSTVDGIAFDSAARAGGGVVRTAALVARTQNDDRRLVPSSAALGLLRAEGLPPDVIVEEGEVVVGGRSIPVDANRRVRISFADELLPGGSAIVGVTDVITGRVDRARLAGATVVVGVTDPRRATMVDVPDRAGGRLPAALVDANAINTLLTGTYREPLPWVLAGSVLFLMSFLVAVGSISVPLAPSPLVPVLAAVISWFGTLAAAGSGRVVDVLVLVVAIALSYLATLAWRATRELLRRRRLVRLFSQYVPATVARQLIEPHALQALADGERVEVSVLFCDLRGFTPMCAALEASEVRLVLDRFYAAACEVILSRNGTVMHFNGDEVFGVFGAPLHLDDHAVRTVDAAAALLELRRDREIHPGERELPPFGIGVNSGEVVSAHVGSEARRQYTVIGEAVNIAARLCSAAAADEALISFATVSAVGATSHHLETMEPLELKGVGRPITPFRLTGATATATHTGAVPGHSEGLSHPMKPLAR